ncbi:MAG: hypothetical protein J6P05_06960, partial [Lachnospiraceae bacterium]|nr:hypothetical protein [Lachnospiraceae bacterium]
VRINSVGQNSVPVQEQVQAQAQAQAQVQVQQQGAAGINPVNRANAVSTVQGAVKQPEKSQITSINGQGRVSQGNGSRGKRR